MDIMKKAEAEMQWHLTEAEELRRFIERGRRLSGFPVEVEATNHKPTPIAANGAASFEGATEANSAARKRGPRSAPKTGVLYETAMFVKQYMATHGEGRKTRDLLPLVLEAGFRVGGQNEIATLSARLGVSKMFRLEGGKWFIRREADEETADTPSKDTSAASLFSNQEGGESIGTALAD
jgi:hypothetical protein